MGVIFTFIVGLFMAFEPITDNDWFWHYVIGNFISDNKVIPNHELFVWVKDYAWTAHEWLTEFIMYKLGPMGCLIIMLIIFLGLYILLAKNLRVKLKKIFDFKLIYLLMLTVFFKVTGPRPYIISLLFLAYLVYILFKYIDEPKKYNKLLWTIPILQILWVNFHGGSSSLAYLFIIGVLLCHYFMKIIPFKIPKIDDDLLNKKQVKNLFIILGLTIVATIINPFGIKMLLYPFTNMADDFMLDNILEWASPSFHGFFGLYIFIMMAFPLFNLILSKEKYKLHEIGFQLMFFYMALKSQRFVGMYAIYSTWNIGKYFFVTYDMYEKILKPFKKYNNVIKYCFCTLLCILAVFVGMKQIKSFANTGVIDNHGFYSDEAVKKIIELQPKRLYNDFGQGGYLLYKLNEYKALDRVKIFSYGLGDVFSHDILPDTVNLEHLYSNPEEILKKYNFDYLLTTNTYTLHYYLDASSDYEMIYSDSMCYIYRKV